MIKRMLSKLLFGRPIEEVYSQARRYWNKGGVYRYYSIYLTRNIQKKYACYLSPKAQVGTGLELKHPVGVVIGDGVKIGDNVTIYQSVTLGAARIGDGIKGLYPEVCDECVLFAGAVIVGNIKIGSNSIVAANAVVTRSFNKNSTLVGIPATNV